MAGKKFAAEFALRRNVSAQDKILIQDSDDDVVKYAYPPQIASLSGYAYAKSIADLPLLPSNKSIGYIVGQMLYIYVGMGGDTKDGLYQSVGFFVGPQGVQGEKGEKGERGEQGVQGPKGDNGGLSLQELDVYLASKQYVTGDTLADMLAGYVSNTSLMRDYVTIAKAQDVTGVKNFTAGVQFGGLPMYKSKDDTVYLDANLVVRGAVTMYGMNTTTSPSIFSALPIDGKTIGRNERGELYVIGGTGGGSGSGGVADSVAWENVTNKPTWITDTKPKYSYSEILDTPDLSVYAIKLSVDNALSGKADKATTLAGYGITNAYTKSEVNNIIGSLDDTYVTIAGEEQGITAEHNFVNGFKVGGLPIKKSQDKTLYLDANLVVSGAITMYGSDSTTFPTIWANIPFNLDHMSWDGSQWSVVGGGSSGGLDLVQLADYLTTNGYATQSWVTGRGYITSSALSGYLPKAGGNLTGNIIMTDGVTIRSSEGNVAGTLKFGADTTSFRTILGTAKRETLLIGTTAIKFWRGANSKEYTVLDSYNYADYALPKNGTAAAASKLATSRSLWGCAFDGSADLTGSLVVSTGEGYRINYNGYDLRFIVSGNSANRGIWDNTLNSWMMYRDDTENVRFPKGNVGIGDASPSYKLHVRGTMGVTDAATFASNINLTSTPTKAFADAQMLFAGGKSRIGVTASGLMGLYANTFTFRPSSTTSASASSFTIDANANLATTGKLTLPIGSSNYTNASLWFGDSVRIGANSSNSLGIFAGYAIRLNPDSATSASTTKGLWLLNSGYNGVNNTSPTEALDVVGNIKTSGKVNVNGGILEYNSILNAWTLNGNLLVTGGVSAFSNINGFTPSTITDAVMIDNRTIKRNAGGSLYAVMPNSMNGDLAISGRLTTQNNIVAEHSSNPFLALKRDGTTWYCQVTSSGIKLGQGSAKSINVDTSGNLTAPGSITPNTSSDERLKRNLRKFNASEVLMSLGRVWEYEYIDSEVRKNHIYEGTHFGLIYQRVKGTKLDVMCHEREDGMGALNYIHPKFISLIAGATMENISEVEKLKRKIRTLENKVKQLERVA